MQRLSYMQRVVGIILLSLWASFAPASEPLPSDIIQDLNALQQQLTDAGASDGGSEALDTLIARATGQAARLQAGNRSDQWASALYSQLAAGAMARQGRQAEAAEQLANARKRSGVPASQLARWQREEAGLRRAAGQRGEAIALYEQWLDSHADAQVSWQLVYLLAQEERWERAAEYLAPLLEQRDSLNEARQSLVLAVLRNAGQNDAALAWLLEGLDSQSAPEAWRQAAGLAQQAGQPGVAAGVWEMAWQLGKFTQPEERLLLIQLHLAGGTPARAAEHLTEALQNGMLPQDEQTLRLLATAWQQAKHVQNALAAWKDVAKYTQQARDWRQVGQLAYAWDEEALAKHAFTQALALGDAEVESWLVTLR
ncbi:hypothetical protein P8S55_03660 [Halomonas sp. M1]|uniref:hypothetical protein n=1 Tax=Halomonas sp. M1 TaxID=3035470 RepID=UPI002485EB30|nr:hypothetical protein [Halomonas sp. M1]WFE72192.1 hypothetical protein P8S55_03660 [Halomonas sp. M1]